jgi:hypothetical protein
MRWLLGLALVAAPVAAQAPADWRRLVSDADRERLRVWRSEWLAAKPALAADPALFDPDRALDDPVPPLGDYRCRTHRLGERARVLDWQPCRLEEDKGLARLVVEGGDQRQVGHVYPDTASRAVFLGTVVIGDERRPLRYGRDRLRDAAGFVERIGEARWRLALPRPSFGGELDLIELEASGPPAVGSRPRVPASPGRSCRADRSASPVPDSPPPPPSGTTAASSSASGNRC